MKQNLLIVSSTFPSRPGTAEPRFIYDLARGLTPHFGEVHALAPGAAGLPSEDTWEGVHVHRFTYFFPRSAQRLCYRRGMMSNLRGNPLLLFLIPFFIAAQVWAILRLCRNARVSVVYSHWLVPQGLAAALARCFVRFRHVLHIHAAGLYLLLRLPRWMGRPIARFIVRRTDHVICVSTYVLDRTRELVGYDLPASVCCMGVDRTLFDIADPAADASEAEILFVGRLVEKKGVEYLLRAIPHVRREVPGAHLRIIGYGALEDHLRALARTLELDNDAVTFEGALPHDEVVGYLRRTRVVTVPSIVDAHGETEGMPTVILEAMAAGRRIVASRVNGTPDLVKDGENGWLCRPADPEDLARKIVAALHDRGDKIPESARRTARQHDWKEVSARVAQWLTERS